MASETQQQLHTAAQLLKAGRRAEALALLKRIIAAERGNVTAWWLAAQAESDPDEIRAALRVVLRLRPDHGRARAMLTRLESAPSQPPTPAGDQTDLTRLTPLKKVRREHPGWLRRNLPLMAGLALGVALIGGSIGLFVLNLTGQTLPGQPPTAGPTPTPIPYIRYDHPEAIEGILPAGATQDIPFYGSAGAVVFAAIQFVTVAGEADTSGAMELISPAGVVVARSGPDSIAPVELGIGSGSWLEYPLDQSGIWALRLVGREGRSAGAYLLFLGMSPP